VDETGAAVSNAAERAGALACVVMRLPVGACTCAQAGSFIAEINKRKEFDADPLLGITKTAFYLVRACRRTCALRVYAGARMPSMRCAVRRALMSEMMRSCAELPPEERAHGAAVSGVGAAEDAHRPHHHRRPPGKACSYRHAVAARNHGAGGVSGVSGESCVCGHSLLASCRPPQRARVQETALELPRHCNATEYMMARRNLSQARRCDIAATAAQVTAGSPSPRRRALMLSACCVRRCSSLPK
jgi:hypothetical protein